MPHRDAAGRIRRPTETLINDAMPSLLMCCRPSLRRAENSRTLAIGAVCVAMFAASAIAREASVSDSAATATAADLSTTIDSQLEATWAASGVTPAEGISDEAFVRRLFLDLAGRVPTLAERAAFLGDPQPNRRLLLIDRLLASEDYARHMADVFDVLLMGRASGQRMRERQEHGWRAWLEQAFRDNRPWNEMAEAMLLARAADPADDPAAWFLYERDNNHQKIAEAVAPAFFGFRIECVQCHNSMTAFEVEQAHYWGLVAFFNRSKNEMTGRGPRIVESAIGGFSEFADIEGTSSQNLLTFLEADTVDEERPEANAEQEDQDDLYQAALREGEPRQPIFSRRERFVEDVLRDHPLVAQAMVNRLWAMLIGRGLVHPFDEMDSAHEISHPELLKRLADEFCSHGYDIRRTLRAIAASQAYQRSSRQPDGIDDPSSFAWHLERPLTAEQFTRSLAVALTGTVEPPKELTAAIRQAIPDVLPDEAVTGIAEPLFLSNGPPLQAALREAAEGSHPLAAMASLPTAEDAAEALFLATLGRQPDPEESAAVAAFLAQPHSEPSQPVDRERLWQAAWAVVTSAEFRFNH